jgi:serine phosphatase RsbU (regulator of sigma subunit)
MEVQVAVEKVAKFASSESGDTVEVIERPHGGISVVLADGQTSGKGAKSISNLVVRKVITLLAEGVRDGAAARAASDYLYTQKGGKVSSTLNICSIDLSTKTIVISRNNPVPVIIAEKEKIQIVDDESKPVGLYRDTRPVIHQIHFEPGVTVILYSDGLIHAGSRSGKKLDIISIIYPLLSRSDISAQNFADELLRQAVMIDEGRPVDDISVVVVRIVNRLQGDNTRRMFLRLPIPSS